MSGTIKGITVEIGGNTGPLEKALQGVNKASADLQSELKGVNTLLKFSPNDTVLLTQKQKLLADSISTTKGKLDTLKEAERQAQVQFAQGKISEENYRNLQREVVKTESQLKALETQAKKANGALTSDQAVGNLKKIGIAIGAAAVAAGAAFVAMGVAELDNADKIQTTADVYGLTAERVQELQYVGTKLDVELETMTKAQSMLTKSMYAAKDGTGAQAEAFKSLGVSVVDSNGNMRDSKDVMAEAFTALGKMTNETERDALAQKLFGKSAMELNPLIKASAGEIAKLTDEAHKSGAVLSNESVEGLDSFKDSMDAAKVSVMGMVGEALAKILPQLEGMLTNLKALPAWVDKNSTLLTVIGIVIGTLVTAFIAYNVAAAWGAIVTGAMTIAMTAFGAVLAFITSPITIVILAIGALIAIGFLLYKNWDAISAFLSSIWTSIATMATNVWNGIGAFFVNTWTSIATMATNTWNGIGTFFVNLWAGITNTIQNVWNGIKVFFITVWQGIVTGVMAILNPFILGITNIFNSIMPGLTIIFNGIKLFFIGVWNAIKLIFLGPILLICDLVTGNFGKLRTDAVAIFTGLQAAFGQIWNGIKLVFTGVVTAIAGFLRLEWTGIVNIATTVWNGLRIFFVGLWNGITSTATNAWNGLRNFFVGLWNGITSTATNAWNGLKNAVSSIMSSTVNGAINIFNGLLNFFRNLPGTMYSLGSSMISSLKSGISSVMGSITGAVSSGFNGAISFIKGLPNQAMQWGKDFVYGIANGIWATISSVTDAVSAIAAKIRSYLHFSVPDEGPLTEYENWMPDFMGGLAKGIENSKYLVANAVKGLSSNMSIGMNLTPAMAGMGSMGNSTNTTNSYGSILHTDKVVINNGMDIQTLAEELSFYMKQKSFGLGGT